MLVGKGQRFGPVEKERFARVHSKTAVVLFDEEAHGLQPDGRQVHAFVLFGLEAFDRHATFAAQFAAAPQGGVRAFEAFHGHHHALFDHDALADVKPAERFGDGPAVVDFRNLLG